MEYEYISGRYRNAYSRIWNNENNWRETEQNNLAGKIGSDEQLKYFPKWKRVLSDTVSILVLGERVFHRLAT
jgi:DNA modification methylase